MKATFIFMFMVIVTVVFLVGCREEELLTLQSTSTDLNATYQSGEVIIVYKTNIRKSSIDSIHRKCGSIVKKQLLKSGSRQIDLVTLPASMSVEEAIEYYKQLPEVESVEPNRILKKYKTIPNDTNLSPQWHHDRTLDSSGATLMDIQSTLAWDTTQGESSIIVAIIDTGIDSNHPDLRRQLWHNVSEGVISDGVDNDHNGYIDDVIGYDFVNDDFNPNDDDVDGHGTHVAGLIAAEGNNSIGTSGVAWRASLMSLKILDSDGYGELADEVEAIRYAVDNGARIINMSLGGTCGDAPSSAEYEAIRYAKDNNVLVVIASGNDACNTDATPTYPAAHPLDNILSIGAIDRFGTVPYFSNYGASSVHLSAPGEDIYSTVPISKGSYALMSGTSMATPITSGSALLVWAHNPSLGYKQVREKLMGSAILSTTLEGKNLMGGSLDVARALTWEAAEHPPIKPAMTKASRSTSGVALEWRDNSTAELGYRLKRAFNTESNVSVSWNLAPDTTSFTDSEIALEEGNIYLYWVEAYNASGISKSNIMTVAVPLSAPIITSISAPYANRVELQWNDTSSIEDGYVIYRSSSYWGGFSEIKRLGANTTSYTDNTTLGETTYYYLIKAYKGSTFSEESNLVQTVTPKSEELSVPTRSGGGAFGWGEILVLLFWVLVGSKPLQKRLIKRRSF